MNNEIKLQRLLDAIDEVEIFPDQSVRIKWASNVFHEYPGHCINVADGSVILQGHQVHFNPDLGQSFSQIEFKDIQNRLDQGIEHATQAKGQILSKYSCD